MIDIHCHILPGIDDGAKSMDESLKILRKAEQAGVTDIVLTPHYMWGTIYNADNQRKWQLYQELKQKAKQAGIKVNLYLGNEIYIDKRLPKMLKGYVAGENKGDSSNERDENPAEKVSIYDLSTLNSRKYVLIEFPMQEEDKSALSIVEKMVEDGFVPVIAHPERYHYVQDDPAVLNKYILAGCRLQGNYKSLIGRYGKRAEKTIKKLLQHNMLFCLASDIHKGSDEYCLDEATKKLEKLLKDPKKVKALFEDNPALLLKF